MERSKLKDIVLLLLVLTNLGLLFFVLRQEIREYREYAQARTSAIGFLANKGVDVEESLVPDRMTLLPQRVERDRAAEAQAAAAFLKGDVQEESRGGEVYRYYNDNGSIQFHSDGAFSAELTPGAYPTGEDRDGAALALLKTLSFEGEVMAWLPDSIIVRQNWEGAPLFNQQVTVEWDGAHFTALTGGRRLSGQPVEDESRTTMTVATALVSFFNGLNGLGDVCSRVDVIAQGYVSAASLNGPVTLTPVWRVTTDTGAYQLDLLTGALTRAA